MGDGIGGALGAVPRPALYAAGAVVLAGLVLAARGGGGTAVGGVTVVNPAADPAAAQADTDRHAADLSARAGGFAAVAELFGTVVGSDTAGTLARVQAGVSNAQTAAAYEAARVQAWASVQASAVAAGATTAQARIAADAAYDVARTADAGETARARIGEDGATERARVSADASKFAAGKAANATKHAADVGIVGQVLGGALKFFGL